MKYIIAIICHVLIKGYISSNTTSEIGAPESFKTIPIAKY